MIATTSTGHHDHPHTYLELVASSYFISSKALYYFRLGALIYFIALTIWSMTFSPAKYFGFFTNLSLWGLCLYFACAMAISRYYHKYNHVTLSTESKTRRLGYAFEVLFSITQTVAWIVAVVYWALLSGSLQTITNDSLKAINIIEHSTNLILALIDLFLSRSTLAFKDAVYPIIVAFLYVFWTWIFVYAGIWDWPYSFFSQLLDPLNKPAWLVIVGLIGGTVIFLITFSIVFGFYRLREALALRKKHKDRMRRRSARSGRSSRSSSVRRDSTQHAPVILSLPPAGHVQPVPTETQQVYPSTPTI